MENNSNKYISNKYISSAYETKKYFSSVQIKIKNSLKFKNSNFKIP